MVDVFEFPSGNWGVNGVFVQKKGNFKESIKRQIRLLNARNRYDKEATHDRVVSELKKALKELN